MINICYKYTKGIQRFLLVIKLYKVGNNKHCSIGKTAKLLPNLAYLLLNKVIITVMSH